MGIVKLINATYNEKCNVIEAVDGIEAIDYITQHQPDIAILDVQMPKKNGLEVARFLKDNHPDTKIIILTMVEDRKVLAEALAIGVDGFVLKGNDIEEVISCVQAIQNNQLYLPKELQPFRKANNDFLKGFTKSEVFILTQIALEKTTKQIAYSIKVKEKTIENHRGNICKKLGLTGKNSLLKYVMENKSQILNG